MGEVIFRKPPPPVREDLTGPKAPDATPGSLYRAEDGQLWVKTSWEGYMGDKWKPVRWYHFGLRKLAFTVEEQ